MVGHITAQSLGDMCYSQRTCQQVDIMHFLWSNYLFFSPRAYSVAFCPCIIYLVWCLQLLLSTHCEVWRWTLLTFHLVIACKCMVSGQGSALPRILL